MKKLLAILAATSLTISSGALLVSCSNGLVRQDKIKYNLQVLEQVLFEVLGKDIKIDVNMGDYLTESEVNEIIQSILDSALGLQYSFESTNSNLNKLGVENNQLYKDVGDFNTKSYKKQSTSIAQKKLFKEYTTALSNNESFDFQILMDGFSLGIIEETNIVELGTNKPYTVEPNTPILFGENKLTWATSVEGVKEDSGIPTIEMFTQEYTDGDAQFYVNAINENEESKIVGISALTALSLRFQDYFVNQLESEIISNVMVMGHMMSKLFKYKENDAYINPTNLFTSKLQDFNPSNTDWNSNVKMIWTIKYDKDVVAENKIDLFEKINVANLKLKRESIKDVLFDGSNDGKILGIDPILDNTSYDSYFGLSGFQGIKFDTFGDDPTSGKAWADQVNQQQNGARIIYNSDVQPGFETDNPNYNEIVVVLPIYFIELMAGNKSKGTPEESKASDTSVYTIKDANGNQVSKIKLGRAGSDEEDIWAKWEGFRSTKGSIDVRDTLAQDENRDNLINELMYMACMDTNFVDAAKRDIYSKYLDKDTIYYSGLWDMVKQYIDDSEDEDM